MWRGRGRGRGKGRGHKEPQISDLVGRTIKTTNLNRFSLDVIMNDGSIYILKGPWMESDDDEDVGRYGFSIEGERDTDFDAWEGKTITSAAWGVTTGKEQIKCFVLSLDRGETFKVVCEHIKHEFDDYDSDDEPGIWSNDTTYTLVDMCFSQRKK
eukprot:TRINITY_DN26175_c0_g1_i1.p1 TRINITY_DN26175_c0_g1~~TRINITY_DN26175_c0_g1_i1.p1  ORF type:complete len:155 (+),score=17.24 TRINITY_DN26175_c0_g1_i1:36-500(+)